MKLQKRFYFSAFFLLLCLIIIYPSIGIAETSNCLIALHRQAISDAIKLTPSEMQVFLKENEASMLRQVGVVHAKSSNDRMSYENNFNIIVDGMKTLDKNRLAYLSRVLTDITIYPFLKYIPIRTYDYCNDSEVLNSVSVVYDGFNPKTRSADYSENSFKYNVNNKMPKLQLFYSILVNEISDLWASTWRDAGRDFSDMPASDTIVRQSATRKNIPKKTETAPVAVESSGEVFSERHLGKYKEDVVALERMRKENAAIEKSERDYMELKQKQKEAEESAAAAKAEQERLDNIECYTRSSGGHVSGGHVSAGGQVSGGSVSPTYFYRICKDKKTGKVISKERI